MRRPALREGSPASPLGQKGKASLCAGPSVAAVVGELHVDAEVFGLQRRDRLLQHIAVLAADPQQVALNGGLDFEFAVFDDFDDLFGFFGGRFPAAA